MSGIIFSMKCCTSTQFDKMRKDVPISDPQDPAIYQHLQASVGNLLNKLIQE